MPALDLRAVILLAGAMGALMSVVLYFLRRNYPPSVKGLGCWAAGPALIFVSTLLFGARGLLPDLITVIVANTLLLLGVVSLYIGSRAFFGQEIDRRPWGWAIAVTTLIVAWFTLVQPDYSLRLLIVTLFLAGNFILHARLVARYGGSGFAARFVLIVLIVETVVLLLRASSALMTNESNLLQATPLQTLYIAAYSVAMLMLTVGLILLATERLRRELEHLATHDPLTGIFTRRALLDAGTQELTRGQRHSQPMSLLMLDLDHFKLINDTYGHLTGDQVLIDFVTRVGELLRNEDHFGRYGGEEFVALLPQTNGPAAVIVAERIREAIAASAQGPCYTVSIGIAEFSPADIRIDDVLDRADKALYQAKVSGRNRVVLATPEAAAA
jgi:diguanylate cyclase (GGDEF)-like protein